MRLTCNRFLEKKNGPNKKSEGKFSMCSVGNLMSVLLKLGGVIF